MTSELYNFILDSLRKVVISWADDEDMVVQRETRENVVEFKDI